MKKNFMFLVMSLCSLNLLAEGASGLAASARIDGGYFHPGNTASVSGSIYSPNYSFLAPGAQVNHWMRLQITNTTWGKSVVDRTYLMNAGTGTTTWAKLWDWSSL